MTQCFKNTLESIFRKLKENEDEKIRKNMFNFFKDEYGTNSNSCFAGIKVKDIIAWLEKQSKKEYTLKSFNDEDVHKFIQYIEKQEKKNKLETIQRRNGCFI